VKEIDRVAYLIYAKSARYQRQVARAEDCIRAGLALCSRPVVSMSLGKDSACMLWLVMQIAPQTPVRMMTRAESRALHPDLDDVVARWCAKLPEMDFVEIDGDSYGRYGSRSGNIRRVIRESGDYDGQFVGLRTDESASRSGSVAHWHRLAGQPHAIWRYAESDPHGRGGSYRICPIADWTVEDIGALIAVYDIPILAQYDIDGLSGRTSLGLNRTGRELGAVGRAKARGERGAYNRLIRSRPDIERES
jgi:3'-phosphoadenosine 5'-phosphosulfate sulfotransferase (PAPS reductase)/FAD synthetase